MRIPKPTLAFWLRLLIPVVLVAVPCAVLLQVVPDQEDQALVPDSLGWRALSVPLGAASGPDSERTGRIVFRHADPQQLLARPQLKLLMATLGASPQLGSGVLRFAGTPCLFATAPGAELRDNRYLSFFRDDNCQDARPKPGAAIELELVYRGTDRVDVWTYVPPANDGGGPYLELAIAPAGTGGVRPLVRGRAVSPESGPGIRRITLLNHVWQVARRPNWLWAAMLFVAVLVTSGTVLFPWQALDVVSPRLLLRVTGAAMCLAAGLGLMYAVLVPPLHAPDEPDHLLSYAKANHDDRLIAEAEMWARVSHFERIKFHADEAFRPADMGTAYPVAWGSHVFAEDVAKRSPTTFLIWKALAPFLADVRASRVLLTIRLANALLFSLAVGAATALLLSLRVGPYPQLAIFFYLLVPTLPFFVMHVSEFGPLTSFYVLLAACLVALLLDGPRSHFVGFPLGLASALVFASGRSAGPMAAVVLAALAGRVVIGSRSESGTSARAWAAVVFWGGFSIGACAIYLLANSEYRENLAHPVRDVAVVWAQRATAAIDRHTAWLLAAAALGAVAEIAIRLFRRRFPWSFPNRILAWMGYGSALVILVEFIASGFFAFPALNAIELPNPPGAPEYVRQVLTVMGTSFRIGSPDLLLVTSFWAGFGWVDTLPNPMLVSALMIATGLAAVSLLFHLSRARDGRRLSMLFLMVLGLSAALAVYAMTSRAMQRNVHGRYLVGWYLVALGLAWSSVVLVPVLRRGVGQVSMPRTVPLFAACGGVHAYCLWVILQRYFQ